MGRWLACAPLGLVGSNPTPGANQDQMFSSSSWFLAGVLRHGSLLHASFCCDWLSYGGSGLVSGLFAGSGFGLGFSGVVESPWKALENRLGWLVSESGLILGYFCFYG